MTEQHHWAVFTDNRSDKKGFIGQILSGRFPPEFAFLHGKKAALFSKFELERFIEEEERHDHKILTPDTPQSLQTMSSGERKKALLTYLLGTKPDYLVLDNPFDNLDKEFQAIFRHMLVDMANELTMIQLISRTEDLLPFVGNYAFLKDDKLEIMDGKPSAEHFREHTTLNPDAAIPGAPDWPGEAVDPLIRLKNVSVSYYGKPILRDINWQIRPGEFWELSGCNGSGKTTILSMITGDNPKGYGQELFIFGRRKGSGETVWDIKKQLGYFTPAMTDSFRGYHSLENMLISGLTDSIGLYVRPTEIQGRIAREWLQLLGLENLKDTYFHDLSEGLKRLVMCARAMVKHPLLLILDEPTAGLDDESAALLVALVNKFARVSRTAIVFVSHRAEPGLKPNAVFQLEMTSGGSVGKVVQAGGKPKTLQ